MELACGAAFFYSERLEDKDLGENLAKQAAMQGEEATDPHILRSLSAT